MKVEYLKIDKNELKNLVQKKIKEINHTYLSKLAVRNVINSILFFRREPMHMKTKRMLNYEIAIIILSLTIFLMTVSCLVIRKAVHYYYVPVDLPVIETKAVTIKTYEYENVEYEKHDVVSAEEEVMDESLQLNKVDGVFNGPSGKEKYYNLSMLKVVEYMRNDGYSEKEFPYYIRRDGVKMFGDYVMVAADLNKYPKGTIVETSLGDGIVCDTGDFIYTDPNIIDIAVIW